MLQGYTDMKPSHLAGRWKKTEHVLSAMGNWTDKDAQTSLDSKKQDALSRPGSGPEGGARAVTAKWDSAHTS